MEVLQQLGVRSTVPCFSQPAPVTSRPPQVLASSNLSLCPRHTCQHLRAPALTTLSSPYPALPTASLALFPAISFPEFTFWSPSSRVLTCAYSLAPGLEKLPSGPQFFLPTSVPARLTPYHLFTCQSHLLNYDSLRGRDLSLFIFVSAATKQCPACCGRHING